MPMVVFFSTGPDRQAADNMASKCALGYSDDEAPVKYNMSPKHAISRPRSFVSIKQESSMTNRNPRQAGKQTTKITDRENGRHQQNRNGGDTEKETDPTDQR